MVNLSAEEVSVLRKSMLLQELSNETFEQFLQISHRASFKHGEILFKEGDYTDYLFIIISGSVDLLKLDEDGYTNRLIETLGPGQSLGELRIIKDQPCLLTVKAHDAATVLCTSLNKLRTPKFSACYKALLHSIIYILNDRLSQGNQSVVKTMHERNKTTKKLAIAFLVIMTLVVLLLEIGAAMYNRCNNAALPDSTAPAAKGQHTIMKSKSHE